MFPIVRVNLLLFSHRYKNSNRFLVMILAAAAAAAAVNPIEKGKENEKASPNTRKKSTIIGHTENTHPLMSMITRKQDIESIKRPSIDEKIN